MKFWIKFSKSALPWLRPPLISAASKSKSECRANGVRVECPLQNVVCTEYDSRSTKLRRTVKLVERGVITRALLLRLSPARRCPSHKRKTEFVSACVIGRKFAMCRYTSSNWARSRHVRYTINNSSDMLRRNVGGEAPNLSVNFEARFSMHGNWYASLPGIAFINYIDSWKR